MFPKHLVGVGSKAKTVQRVLQEIKTHYTVMNDTGVMMWSGTLKRMVAVKGCMDTALFDRPAYHECIETASCCNSIAASIVGRLANRYTALKSLREVDFDVQKVGTPMSVQQLNQARKSISYYWAHRNKRPTIECSAYIQDLLHAFRSLRLRLQDANDSSDGVVDVALTQAVDKARNDLELCIRPFAQTEKNKGSSRVKGSYLYWTSVAPILYEVMTSAEQKTHNTNRIKWEHQEQKRKIKRLKTLCKAAGLPDKEYLKIMGTVEENEYKEQHPEDMVDIEVRIQVAQQRLKDIQATKMAAFQGDFAGFAGPVSNANSKNTCHAPFVHYYSYNSYYL